MKKVRVTVRTVVDYNDVEYYCKDDLYRYLTACAEVVPEHQEIIRNIRDALDEKRGI
jgi:hypothetical protein